MVFVFPAGLVSPILSHRIALCRVNICKLCRGGRGWALRASLLALVVWLSSVAPAPAAAEAAPEGEGSLPSFEALRTELLEADGDALAAFDFTALRQAWVGHASYHPYLHTQARYHRVIQGLKESLDRGDAAAAVDLCAVSLDLYLMDVQWNVGCSRAYGAAERPDRAARHRAIAEGLRASILDSGDGAGPDSAFQVVSVPEEHTVLQALGLVPEGSRSAHPDGRHFDIVTARPRAGGEARTLYFDIDPLWHWLRDVRQRVLEEKAPAGGEAEEGVPAEKPAPDAADFTQPPAG